MAHVVSCPECGHEVREMTAEDAIKRAAAHSHEHHGGPAEITPELEAQLRGRMREE